MSTKVSFLPPSNINFTHIIFTIYKSKLFAEQIPEKKRGGKNPMFLVSIDFSLTIFSSKLTKNDS